VHATQRAQLEMTGKRMWRARMVVVLMLTTVPDAATAAMLADRALDARLAACVSELGAIKSRYHWQGKVETADEIQLLFKTSPMRALELERFIVSHHPYETPEIVSWQATASDAYGRWVAGETQRLFHV
jgi:periplasmic divalent cation tolerance protein